MPESIIRRDGDQYATLTLKWAGGGSLIAGAAYDQKGHYLTSYGLEPGVVRTFEQLFKAQVSAAAKVTDYLDNLAAAARGVLPTGLAKLLGGSDLIKPQSIAKGDLIKAFAEGDWWCAIYVRPCKGGHRVQWLDENDEPAGEGMAESVKR